MNVLDPTLINPQSSAWDGEALYAALHPQRGLGDVGDMLTLAQGLRCFKGQDIAMLKDTQSLLFHLHESAALTGSAELRGRLLEITRTFNEAQSAYEEKKVELEASQRELTSLFNEVLDVEPNSFVPQEIPCDHLASAAAEDLIIRSKQEVESGRVQLLNFTKQDGVELRKVMNQQLANEEHTPTLALMELCCMMMRVSSTPTRDEIRNTLSEPDFATKLEPFCAVDDAESFPEAFVEPMKEAVAAAEGMDAMDVKALTVLASVALAAYRYTTTESEYNVHYAKHHQDPGDFWDAPLTSTGEEQAASLKQKLLPEKVDLVVSSPLTRPHLATPLASEHMEASCDIGRPTSELRAVYPKVDFQDLSEVWWYVPQECRQGITVEESRRLFTQEGRRESRKDFERRVDDFVSWLSQRPEKVIAIFAHADFFNCFLHRYFGETEAKYQDYWMKNCELLQLPLQKPLMPILHPSLPDAAIAAPREADVPVALTPSRAAQALETLRQDLAQQRPELTPKELWPKSFQGQLHDLAIRSQLHTPKAKVLSVVAWVRRQCRLLSDLDRVEMVIQMLRREQLLSVVRNAIVHESKARGIFAKIGFDHFLTQARFVLQVERERSCITSMVENWGMMQRMLNFKETSDCTHLNERVEKAGIYWGSNQAWQEPPEGAPPRKAPSLEDRYLSTCRTRRAVPVPLSFVEGQSAKLDGRDMLEESLGSHQNLESVALAGVGLGGTFCTAECARRLVGSMSFSSLDLSWNCFDAEDFQQMGKQLMQTKPGTSSVVGNYDCSISELLEALSYNTSLTYLSIAANRIVANDAKLLVHFDAEGCFTGGPDHEDDIEQSVACKTFSFTNPGGRYRLDLKRPYHRAMLRMLCKTAERYKVPLEKPMSDVSYSLGSLPPVTKHPSSGIWQVPSAGELSFTFSVESEIEANMQGVDEDDFVGFLQMLGGRSLDQEVFIQALAKDFNMTVGYVQHLCNAAPAMEAEVINAMLPCTPEDGGSRYLLLQTLRSLPAFVMTYQTMECFLLFNVSNPTGHYKLELNNTSQFAVAQRLLLLDRWEVVMNKRRGRVDISSRGNESHFRNELHAGQPLRSQSVAEWTLPEADEFECDYVSSKRPSVTAQALTDQLWERLMVNLHKSQCSDEERLKVIRAISHEIYITAKHMRQMMGFFKESQHRQDCGST
eukprot:g28115.t1